ncbi:MAG TPA: hemerythrin domain-containing protein [Caulobacteraceae bacterium]
MNRTTNWNTSSAGRLKGGYPQTCEADMSTTAKTTEKDSGRSGRPRRTRRTGQRDPLAVKLLKQDHREVETMFDEYEQLDADADKLALFKKIALALKVHTKIEEEIFYAEERGDVEDDLLDEAHVEHEGATHMIVELEGMKPSEQYYDAMVKVLGENVRHHIREEEQPGGIFAQAKRGGEDLEAMGERLKARKAQLLAQFGAKPH